MKSNIELLKEKIGYDDEAVTLLDNVIAEYEKTDDDAFGEIQEKIDELSAELEKYNSVDLGLDTLHYRLEKGNLKIQQKLESFIRAANTIPNAEPLLFK